MKTLKVLVMLMVIGATESSLADGKPERCDEYFPMARKESYYPCMWQVRNIVDLFGFNYGIYSACFPKKDASGNVVSYDIYPAAHGIAGGSYYFTEVSDNSTDREKSNGKKIMIIETAKDGNGEEYIRVIDLHQSPRRVVALTKKGCLLHSFNLVDADQKGHTISGETCKAIIDARKGKNGSEGKATDIAREKSTTEKSMYSALRNCDNHTTIGVLARRNPSAKSSGGGSSNSGGSSGGKTNKAH